MNTGSRSFILGAMLSAVILIGTPMLRQAIAQPSASVRQEKPYLVEWVYKVKYGYHDEFFQLFKKYQVRILDREKELGYVTTYTIYAPSLHTSEDSRWDYRVVIQYRSQASSEHSAEITKQLFPDTAILKKEENRWWELTRVHWDLPIHTVDVSAE